MWIFWGTFRRNENVMGQFWKGILLIYFLLYQWKCYFQPAEARPCSGSVNTYCCGHFKISYPILRNFKTFSFTYEQLVYPESKETWMGSLS
jgi:hypothetical protein